MFLIYSPHGTNVYGARGEVRSSLV